MALAAPSSSVGSKLLVGVTGLGLSLFVLAHMLGNLQIYLGPDAINSYAEKLQHTPEILWTGRLGLLFFFLAHIVTSIRLKMLSRAARPTPYVVQHREEASLASVTMVYTGLMILFFLLYHLAHFTMGWVQTGAFEQFDSQHRHDVYAMMVKSFQNPIVAGLYILAMVFLWLHMSHGVSSAFQSLGVTRPRWEAAIHRLGRVVTWIVVVGNISIPLSILCGIIKLPR